MIEQRPPALAGWHAAIAANDFTHVPALLADDVTFLSPAVHTPQHGKTLALGYLRAAMTVLNTPTFRYTGEWLTHESAVLEFELELEGFAVNGVDIIRWNDAGLITEFKVMVRPWKGLEKVVALMRKALPQ